METTALKEPIPVEGAGKEVSDATYTPEQLEEGERRKVADSLSQHFGQPIPKEDITPITDETQVRLEGDSLKVGPEDVISTAKNALEDKWERHVVGQAQAVSLGEGGLSASGVLGRIRKMASAVGGAVRRRN